MSQRRRAGARSPALVPEKIRLALEAGEPSVSHMEQMAIDMSALLTTALPELACHASRLRNGGFIARMRMGGELIAAARPAAAKRAASHRSDTVRGWAAMAVAARPGLDLAGQLSALRPFAADEHFAVREWAWLAARPAVAARPHCALRLLEPWTEDSSPNIRRFASEATRPRGVWSVHIPALKDRPEPAAPLLTALCGDPSRYVQDSVSNWLNDAARSRPDWVHSTCERWLEHRPGAATQRICRRAQRSLAPQ